MGKEEKFVKSRRQTIVKQGIHEKIMKMNREKLETLAKDLRQEDPRPAHQKMAGFEMAARTLDKCRATLLGIEGDFRFGCPMDQEFFHEAGIDQKEFEALVAGGASDDEVARWLQEQSSPSANP